MWKCWKIEIFYFSSRHKILAVIKVPLFSVAYFTCLLWIVRWKCPEMVHDFLFWNCVLFFEIFNQSVRFIGGVSIVTNFRPFSTQPSRTGSVVRVQLQPEQCRCITAYRPLINCAFSYGYRFGRVSVRLSVCVRISSGRLCVCSVAVVVPYVGTVELRSVPWP